MKSDAEVMSAVWPIWREAASWFRRVWTRGIIVTALFIAVGLGMGVVYSELLGTEVLGPQYRAEWAWEDFLFNWVSWVLHYLAYAFLLARLMALQDIEADEGLPPLRFMWASLPVFAVLALPSSIVSTWMPNATFTARHALMMAPQSLLDVILSVVGLRWAMAMWLGRHKATSRPDWKELPFRTTLKLVLGLTVLLASAEMAYAGLGEIRWQVLTGSYNLAVVMRAVTWCAAFAALYLNVVFTPCLMIAWYRNLPSAKSHTAGIRTIFS